MDVIFMGSSEFSIPSLSALLKHKKIQIKEVYTKPPSRSGRNLKIVNTPVHSFAADHCLEVHTPSSLRECILKECDFIVVVSYGLFLPQKILEHPRFTCLNIHPSLLPRWRGAAPIQYTIMEGDDQYGVSIIEVTPEMDAGRIYSQKAFEMKGDETFKEIHDRLAQIGAESLISVIENFNTISPVVQNESLVTFSKKLPNSVTIDFDDCLKSFLRKMRVFGKASTTIADRAVYVYSVGNINPQIGKPGILLDRERKELVLQFKDGRVSVEKLQPFNKKVISTQDFINGLQSQLNT